MLGRLHACYGVRLISKIISKHMVLSRSIAHFCRIPNPCKAIYVSIVILPLFILMWIIIIISISIFLWPGKLNYLNEFKYCCSRFAVSLFCPLDSKTQTVRSICMDELWICYSNEMFGVSTYGFSCRKDTDIRKGIQRGLQNMKRSYAGKGAVGNWKLQQFTQISYRSF